MSKAELHTILIVEDHPVVTEGLKQIIRKNFPHATCLTAFDGKHCKDVLNNCLPELILMDINLPDISGTDLCGEILKNHPDIKILAVSSYSERPVIRKMIEAGANGYVLKNADDSEIVEAMETIAEGKNYISEEVKDCLQKDDVAGIRLTKREYEVLAYIAEGLTNPEIADRMFVSASTVDSHRKNLLLKLSAKNTASLVSIAIRNGLI